MSMLIIMVNEKSLFNPLLPEFFLKYDRDIA